MIGLSPEQVARREKTLIAALLLSMWAPLATGIAVALSQSTTQLADFIRRTIELIALFISWRVFRRVEKGEPLSPERKAYLETIAGLSVAGALAFSGLTMLVVTFLRINTFVPGGNVYPGIAIASLGVITNAWFWRRYTKMTAEHFNPIINAQRLMYRAKSFVDLCVIIALVFVAASPLSPATRYIDAAGSIAVSGYLLWSGYGTFKTSIRRS